MIPLVMAAGIVIGIVALVAAYIALRIEDEWIEVKRRMDEIDRY